MSILNRLDNVLALLDKLQIDTNDLKLHVPQNINNNNNNNVNSKFEPHQGTLPHKIIDALNKLNIEIVSSKSHEAVTKSEEHLLATKDMKGVAAKNLLLKHKRSKTQWLVVFDAKKQQPDLKLLGKHFDAGGGLRFVQDPQVTLSVSQGSITPLAIIFDEHKIVQVVLDQDLKNAEAILVHPGTNAATIGITPKNLESYCAHYGNPVEWLDLGQYTGDGHEAKESNEPKEPKESKKPKEPKEKSKKTHEKSSEEKPKHDKAQKKPKEKDDKKEDSGAQQEGITFDQKTQFGDWYKEIVTKCELVDYTDISGCFVLRPTSYFMWDQIMNFMNGEFQKLGVTNAYFPLFVSEDALRAEAKHFSDFNPEVAWVTHSGDTPLEKKLAVRPTSETIMYPLFARWIRSFRDLPLKINQWCNVVRWEFKNATPFLRTREFLWQEGHTAHATQEQASKEVYDILDIYARTYSEVCAVPTVKGIKTKNETFPGADFSTTVEAYIPYSGRGIQGATSHCLGQNFAKIFDISFLDENGKSILPVQNSWGYTTRSIGVMIMNHSDNKGLVLPPRIAQKQVVIIPIYFKSSIEERNKLDSKVNEINQILNSHGIRSFIDLRESKNPGFKFNEWELKGVPVRIEIGPNDMKNEEVTIARRDKRDESGKLAKHSVKWEKIEQTIKDLMEDMHRSLFEKAKKNLNDNIAKVTKWEDFLKALGEGKLVLAPHCNESEWEEKVGEKTKEYFTNVPDASGSGQTGKAKALCIPLEQPTLDKDTKCIISGKDAKCWILFGRSY